MNENVERINAQVAEVKGDTNVNVWATRAAVVVSSMIYFPEDWSKEEILKTLEDLYVLTPTTTIFSASVFAGSLTN